MSKLNGKSPLALRFGKRLRKARAKAKLSQSMVGALTNIDVASLSNMEHGHKLPSYGTLRRLCMALNVSGDYLLVRRGR